MCDILVSDGNEFLIVCKKLNGIGNNTIMFGFAVLL